MSILDFLLGRPLASSEESTEEIGVAKGVPVFGLDALGSAAYGPEAALTLLIPLGVAGLAYIRVEALPARRPCGWPPLQRRPGRVPARCT